MALADFDPKRDAIWMAEVEAESTYVWSHKQRIVLFLSAMRHFRDRQREKGWTVHYTELGDAGNTGKLSKQLSAFFKVQTPGKVLCVEPGEYRVQAGLEKTCRQAGVPLEILTDAHFLSTREDFENHAEGRKELRMEYFYREMRKRHRVLLDDAGKPEGEAVVAVEMAAAEDAVPVTVEGGRTAIGNDVGMERIKIGLSAFDGHKACRHDLAGGIINEGDQRAARPAPFKPVMRTAVDLDQFAHTRPA